MGFFLFCLLNAVLFLRPAELVPSLIGLPIYQVVILLNLVAAFPALLSQLQADNLRRNPITLCVFGVLLAVPLSHLRHFDTWSARFSFMDYGKTVLYFLLFIAVINTERRLSQFFTVLLLLLAFMTSLSLLHNHGIIYLPQLDSIEQREYDDATGEVLTFPRLQSTGIFNDPNDFAMILAVGMVMALSFLGASSLLTSPFWLGLLGMFGYALFLTKSRGGILALLVGVGVLAYARWGWKRAALVACLTLPLVAAVFAMRDDGGVESGTGQSRIQLWAEGFSLWKNTLTFGIGYNLYADEVGYVAHNSYVHTFVELGLFGGTMFLGCFYFAGSGLYNQLRDPEVEDDPISRPRTFLALALLASVFTSLLTLSRPYGIPAYVIFGVAATTISFNTVYLDAPQPVFTSIAARRLAVASMAFMVATYLFTRVMVRWE
jgi:O-antigen ligase